MTSISSIPAWNPISARSSAAVTNKVEAPASQAAMPSTIVNLTPESMAASRRGLQGAAGATAAPLLWESKSQDTVSALMGRNFASSSLAGRFSGLGAALLKQFQSDGRGVSQTVHLAPPGAQPTPYDAVGATASAPALHGVGDNKVTLSITTKSGTQVQVALDSQDDGLAVQMTSSGELSDVELRALGGLSAAFQEAIDGMAQEPPQLKLKGLTQFDSSVLASVDLRAAVKSTSEPERTQTLTFHADGAQRKLSFSGVSGTAAVSVDMSKLAGVGSAQQQAKAMDSYLKQFDQAASRGKGDAALMSMFKDAFVGMNSNYGAVAQPSGGGVQSGKWELAVEDRAVLTGLADFSASVTQAAKSSNPMRPSEQDSFSYQVSQSTSITGHSEDDRSISQQQKSELSASFHMPITPGAQLRLDGTLQSQNYDYHQINDSASSAVDLAYEKGRLVKATLNQSASQSTHIMRYELGKLVSDTVTPGQQSLQRDLVAALTSYQRGTASQTRDERIEQRKQMLSGVNEQIFLRAYPDPQSGVWSIDKARAGAMQ
ncbi:hypothetical protein [Janthinobacterium fluminis]|uniref:Lactate dehydrogenase n=1 Tax=Janthinobacterium fluminis TaxID=2987524 RepID=A0ABT5JVB2_9BURK|nr:hypothetical protein [Janthinobacterium fluminis]MDC8756663.1 hypothetical protein [Janthinobacterium fluminis]